MNELPVRGIWADSEAWSVTEALGIGRDLDLADLKASRLVDGAWYAQSYPDSAGSDPEAHFLDHGWKLGHQPNPYFATEWYLRQHPDVVRTGANPLLHYLRRGEAEGRSPAPWFDLPWYRERHRPGPGETLLRHFLHRRCAGTVSPLPEFDPAYYLSTYPDVLAAGVDPFEHYLNWGYREGRNPSAGFDTRYYQRRHLDGDLSENPLLHYRRVRGLIRLHTTPPASETDVFAAVRRFVRPGPDFEEPVKLPPSAVRRAKLLAFYLPQFHAIAENDAWWGRGFTEWTSVARAMPRFAGHYQPRIPRDLGHYTLEGTGVMARQAAMARDAGVHGFVHYFYWFNGHRLLEKPVEAMLADPAVDFPFCLMWANENWTRSWDGSQDQVLMAQDWRVEDEPALLACLVRHFRDPRYIRVQGRPLLMVYRAGLIPDTAATIARWREAFRRDHGEDPLLVMSQSFGAQDPRPMGFDAAVEFPPHKLVGGLRLRNAELAYYDAGATAQVFAYDDVAAAALAETPPDFPLIRTALPGWDNDARREGAGMVLHGASPAAYQRWLAALVDQARARPVFGENLVCVNAWNEWAEGAYLEPDVHYGAAYLNATARAIGHAATEEAPRLLLVGHDAFPAGAQSLLLQLGHRLRRRFGLGIEFLLLGEGALAADYAAAAPTTVITDPALLARHAEGLAARGIRTAIVNSAASAWAVPVLRAAGIAAVLLVHELPRLLAERDLTAAARQGAAAAQRVVFPAPSVRDAFAAIADLPADRQLLLPQGIWRRIAFSPRARQRLRARLGVAEGARLVLGAGYADLRKGFDLFLHAWRAARRRDSSVVFCWLGDIDPSLAAWLGPEIAAAEATGTFHRPGHRNDIADWFSAADLFLLPSREDPFPSVVLEAMAAGLPSIAFAGAGGMPDTLTRLRAGAVVPMADTDAMADAVLAMTPREATRARLAKRARENFDFDAYAGALLREAMPDLPGISVVVPSFNYARYLPARLGSIFAQTHPVAEILVLDDGSSDGSVDCARQLAQEAGRDIAVTANPRPSGSPIAQWAKGADLAMGEYVWIAEADDEADPALLATLAARLDAAGDIDLVACDSRAIDADGVLLRPDYQDYYAGSGAGALARDGVFTGRDFLARFMAERNLILNVSAVLWRRRALLAALERCGPELRTFRSAGDWRLYVALLSACGSIAWVASPLNVHRRHAASITGRTGAARQIAEITRVHEAVAATLGPDEALRTRQEDYRRRLARELGLA